MTKVILIRHGESRANRNNVFAGHYDIELEEKGFMQAELTAKYIQENYDVDLIYSSDLKRAYSTSLALSELIGKDVIKNENFREIKAGEWEAVEFDKLPTLYPEEFKLWTEDLGNSGCVGGETVKELGERVYKTLTDIASENNNKTIAVFTHATPVKAMISLVSTGNLDEMKNLLWVSNASVTEFEYNNGWKLIKVGEDKHLAELKTSLPENV